MVYEKNPALSSAEKHNLLKKSSSLPPPENEMVAP